ncbi:MAG: hypothetical protein EOS70_07595 [Mesorhizobium sp.]|uniref:hypothetical protein n=1 Tax=Mesorhizobium sp. M5C.F.Ca.ET.164.01.1.1 TaxID=2563957 RepID=UPI000FE88DD2|nr:hypothetical protein [Mesorhizobium sp. M5C.F.Ca.ET.164.01.1.1]RWC23736.1 MAG: hypothetical protein EOS51_06475 [Mesorhizobium sp.]RWC35594.1 MAG: hypothetical protein EOS70_07595 [Mesorhizobium sp.]TGU01512.1 hypothetical protein EN807_14215 [Mesorhizobium sp. M5C.F.Ca.ET.164.01.1.1]TIU27608.1 MAG: hypothetical protein E5W53_02395 [Mesorhizobium sp.]TIU79610.1 MAG: hypothetical protein E5W13_06600 [Mesorhizobium sp.]
MTKESNNTQQLLQCMTTEHFVLQTARAATIQEANQRANLFLTSVSSVTIALSFVAQVTEMGMPFVLFSLILLPCLFFIGLVTFVRAVQVAIEDMVHARGMARIRHYYVELAPIMQKYLIHSTRDDRSAVLVDKGLRPSPLQYFMTTAGMVSTISGAIAGVFAGIVATSVIGSGMVLGVISGILAFVVSILLLRRYHDRAWAAAEQKLMTHFPGAPGK